MKNKLLKGWTIQRFLFLIMGILVIFQSADAGQWLGLLLGGYIAFMGLFAFGCAGGGCSIPNKKETDF